MMLTDKVDKIIPKYKAWSFLTFPVGIGLKQVLLIKASRSDSYHILSVPAAPEPIATARREIQAEVKSKLFGAINKPTILVNKTKDITLGFIKLKNEFNSKAKPSLEFLVFILIWLNYFTLGSSSKVWNGGGDDTVHSRVVAPSPHGFGSAFFFFIKAYNKFSKNTARPIIDIYEPIEEI